jgi:DNA-binding Lrp family transcriptional regulator
MTRDSDHIDHEILKHLYRDSSQSSEEIAADMGVGEDLVENRKESLMSSGAIDRRISVVDPVKVGQELPSYHFASFEHNYDRALDEEMAYFSYWKGSQLGMVVLGDYDMIFRKVNKSNADMDIFASNVLGGSTDEGPDNAKSLMRSPETYEVNQRIRWHGQNISSGEQRRGRVEPGDLDPIERSVLERLQQDGELRSSPEKLAEKIDRAPKEVYEALDHLSDENIILGDSIEFHPSVMSSPWYRAFYGLSIEKNYDGVVAELQSSEPLHVPYVVSGTGFSWADLAAELLVPSVELLDKLTDKLRSIEGVKASRTYLSTKELYRDDMIPIPE